MKTKLTKNHTKAITYPHLAKQNSSSLVVLFTEYRAGVALIAGSGHAIGVYSESWMMEDWEILKSGDVLTLENS